MAASTDPNTGVVLFVYTLFIPEKLKTPKTQRVKGDLGCPEQDSNLHVSQHSHLKRARLPFRHLGFCGAKVESFFDTTSDYLEYFLLFCTSVWT